VQELSLDGVQLGVGLHVEVVAVHDQVGVERRTQDEPPREDTNLVVSGTVSDLELTLYHRPTLSPVDVHGDYTVLEEWHRRFTF